MKGPLLGDQAVAAIARTDAVAAPSGLSHDQAMGIKTRLSITVRVVVLPAALLGLLVGCASNPAGNESTGNDQPSGTSTTSVASPAHDLQSAVLTTAELPTGGWTLDADTSSSTGETSTDKGEADLCQGDLSGYFDIGPDAGASTWNRSPRTAELPVPVRLSALRRGSRRGGRAWPRWGRSCPRCGRACRGARTSW